MAAEPAVEAQPVFVIVYRKSLYVCLGSGHKSVRMMVMPATGAPTSSTTEPTA
jgi:hypothetical protein